MLYDSSKIVFQMHEENKLKYAEYSKIRLVFSVQNKTLFIIILKICYTKWNISFAYAYIPLKIK